MFCFFPANLMPSTYTDKKNPFHGVRISIPNWKPSPNRVSKGFSQIALPITVLLKDDHTDFVQKERLGLPYSFGYLCRGRRIHMSGHSDFGIFNNFEASSMLT